MDMVGHQDIDMESEKKLIFCRLEDHQIFLTVDIIKKNGCLIITTCSDMVKSAWQTQPWWPTHFFHKWCQAPFVDHSRKRCLAPFIGSWAGGRRVRGRTSRR